MGDGLTKDRKAGIVPLMAKEHTPLWHGYEEPEADPVVPVEAAPRKEPWLLRLLDWADDKLPYYGSNHRGSPW